jgi:hypothetical protein
MDKRIFIPWVLDESKSHSGEREVREIASAEDREERSERIPAKNTAPGQANVWTPQLQYHSPRMAGMSPCHGISMLCSSLIRSGQNLSLL